MDLESQFGSSSRNSPIDTKNAKENTCETNKNEKSGHRKRSQHHSQTNHSKPPVLEKISKSIKPQQAPKRSSQAVIP